MGTCSTFDQRTRWLRTAQRVARAADVQLTVAMVAEVAASATNWNLADDDTRTCVREASSRYVDAASLYLSAAHVFHGRRGRPGGFDLSDLPDALRTALGDNVKMFSDLCERDLITPTAAADLQRLQSAVTALRATLNSAVPEIFEGRPHPQQRLVQLRSSRPSDAEVVQP